MKTVFQTLIDAIWQEIVNSKIETQECKNIFKTPDDKKRPQFSVLIKTVDDLTIQTNGKAKLKISKESFRRSLEYLIRHNHVSAVQYCDISASKSDLVHSIYQREFRRTKNLSW
jgi:response regulator of citrate/malate metabolism